MENSTLLIIILLSSSALIAGVACGTYYLINSVPVVTNVLRRPNQISINDIELNNLVQQPPAIYSPRSQFSEIDLNNIIEYVPTQPITYLPSEAVNRMEMVTNFNKNYINDPNLIVSTLEESKIYSIPLLLLTLVILILILILIWIAYSNLQRFSIRTTNKKILKIVIIFILGFYNKESWEILWSILALSITEITYYKDLNVDFVLVNSKNNSRTIALFAHNQMSDFFESLDINCNYIITIEFIPDIINLRDESPSLFISKPFLINKFSSPSIVNRFIDNRLYQIVDYYYLDEGIIQDKFTSIINKLFLIFNFNRETDRKRL
jgi:hypothetical protein